MDERREGNGDEHGHAVQPELEAQGMVGRGNAAGVGASTRCWLRTGSAGYLRTLQEAGVKANSLKKCAETWACGELESLG